MSDKQFPANWQISDYDPKQHMMSLKGRDYLNVQNRLLWFIADQRALIVRGLATTSYVIRTELVEHDRDAGYAQFKTYVRDVMGNEATMYGSEAAKDFADYAEKASTKSLGRALLAHGYGTAFAPEMDEGDRVVDSPVERPQNARQRTPQPHLTAQPQHAPASTSDAPAASQTRTAQSATKEQRDNLIKGAAAMGRTLELDDALTFDEAEAMLAAWRREWQQANMRKRPATPPEPDLSTLGNGGGRH